MNLEVLVSTLIINCCLEMPWEDITRQILEVVSLEREISNP